MILTAPPPRLEMLRRQQRWHHRGCPQRSRFGPVIIMVQDFSRSPASRYFHRGLGAGYDALR
jgi:hypothetical protein